MSSEIGRKIKVSIFGESHGTAIGAVVDNLPSGERIDFEELLAFMKRRQGGNNPYSTPRKEADVPEINGVKATYINKSYGLLGAINGEYTNTDLMYISTQVHTRIKDNNVSVIWRIPASLIPVVTYDISLEGDSLDNAENVKINYKAADPIRLIFEVGLSEELNAVNLNDKVVL